MNDHSHPERVVVFDNERYDGEWPPQNGPRFVAWFQARLDSVPEEFRGNVQIEVGSVSGYEDSHYARIEIYYDRPPTEAEVRARKADAENRRARELLELRARVARLESG